jgi:hypothetical protein
MDLGYKHDDDGGVTVTIHMTKGESDLLGEDRGLPILLHSTMEAVIAIRSGARPAGTSTTAGNWAEMAHRTSILVRDVTGVLEGEIRAHAAAQGSHGQLARALGIPRSTAQSRTEALLAKAPSPWEPRARAAG